jgi:hypothetical protein
MLATRMSRFTCVTAVIVLSGAFSGCVGTGWNWRGRSRETVQAQTLPIVPAPQEYQAYADAAAQPRIAQQYAGAGGGCSSGPCGSRSGGCSSGSCRTNVAAGPTTAQANPSYGNAMAQTQPAQQDASTAAGKYGGQKTCPVTDEELGSMGPPIPVAVGGQTIYVCCEGCKEAVQADPDSYVAKVMRERAGQQ